MKLVNVEKNDASSALIQEFLDYVKVSGCGTFTSSSTDGAEHKAPLIVEATISFFTSVLASAAYEVLKAKISEYRASLHTVDIEVELEPVEESISEQS